MPRESGDELEEYRLFQHAGVQKIPDIVEMADIIDFQFRLRAVFLHDPAHPSMALKVLANTKSYVDSRRGFSHSISDPSTCGHREQAEVDASAFIEASSV